MCLRTCHCHGNTHNNISIDAGDVEESTWKPRRMEEVGKGKSCKTLGGHSGRSRTYFRLRIKMKECSMQANFYPCY
jgi:hypothetical protein